MKGCSTTISGEHYISKTLLDKISPRVDTIDVIGPRWILKGHKRSVPKNALRANILCTIHNSKLSDLDIAIGELVETIDHIDPQTLFRISLQFQPLFF